MCAAFLIPQVGPPSRRTWSTAHLGAIEVRAKRDAPRASQTRFRDALKASLFALTAMAPRCAVDHVQREGGPTCGMRNAAHMDRVL
eukprot:1193540-Prorocentrum_minimum.AAC.3